MYSSYEKNIVILNVKTSANLFVTRQWVANGGGDLVYKHVKKVGLKIWVGPRASGPTRLALGSNRSVSNLLILS